MNSVSLPHLSPSNVAWNCLLVLQAVWGGIQSHTRRRCEKPSNVWSMGPLTLSFLELRNNLQGKLLNVLPLIIGDDAENHWDGKRYSNILRCYWCYWVQEVLWEFASFHVLFPASNVSNSRVAFAGRCLGFVPQQTSHTLVKDQARQMHRLRNPYWHGWKYCIWMVGWVLFDYSSTG